MGKVPRFPDFRSGAVLWRALGVCGLGLAGLAGVVGAFSGTVSASALALGLLWPALVAATPWLRRRSYHHALAWTALLASLLVAVVDAALRARGRSDIHVVPVLAAVGGVLVVVFGYLDWRHHRLSPALTEARLLALQSRMRPHFLFNSLNSVLALIRRDPARAEAMLEDLAELYRALLAEPRAAVPLAEELALARAYLAVERVRLGERLQVAWQVDTAPQDALLPPLTLQPLVENAVRHGIEPRSQGGCITVEAFRDDEHLVLFVRNPLPPPNARTSGHGLALANLRERLALLYDTQARLRTYESEGEFVAQVRLPLRAPALSAVPRR